MKKSILKVPTKEQALSLMQSMLFANMIDNGLEVVDPKAEVPEYFIKFGWFSRDRDEEDTVGCPCYVSDFHDIVPGEDGTVHGIVYVKTFATHDISMTKMHFITAERNFSFTEIADGEEFEMEDGSRYLNQGGVIMPLNA